MKIRFNVYRIFFLRLFSSFELKLYLPKAIFFSKFIFIIKNMEQINIPMDLISDDKLFVKFTNALKKFREVHTGDKILVAVSGGLDSVTMLLLLSALKKFKLVIAHINHNIRSESNAEKIYVERLAKKLKIPFYFKKLNPQKINKNESIEQWCRYERYDFFHSVLNQISGKWIMTGHHANDQIETILMNMARQSGMVGLQGIAKSRRKILRPLIEFSRFEIEEFSKRIDFKYYTDSSNYNTSIPRNFIRHKVIAPWEKQQPHLVNGFIKSSRYFKQWTDGFDFLIKKFIISEITHSKNKFKIPISVIESVSMMIKIRLVQLLVDSEKDLWSKHHIKMLDQFFSKESSGNFHLLHNGWKLLYDRNSIIGTKKADYKFEKNEKLKLNHPSYFLDHRYDIALSNQYIFNDANKKIELVDWVKLKDCRLEVRTWKKGDTFQPLGMNGHQKVSDFLINQKIDRISKESQTVITADNVIFWVCGRRLANWVRVTENTRQTAVLSMDYVNR